jgi:hypothetical protein
MNAHETQQRGRVAHWLSVDVALMAQVARHQHRYGSLCGFLDAALRHELAGMNSHVEFPRLAKEAWAREVELFATLVESDVKAEMPWFWQRLRQLVVSDEAQWNFPLFTVGEFEAGLRAQPYLNRAMLVAEWPRFLERAANDGSPHREPATGEQDDHL